MWLGGYTATDEKAMKSIDQEFGDRQRIQQVPRGLGKLRRRGVRGSVHAADVCLKQRLQVVDQQPSVVPGPIETVSQGASDLVPLAAALTGQVDQLWSSRGAKRQHCLREKGDPVIGTDGEFGLVKCG